MRLYSGKAYDFCEDAAHNRIADRLKTAFVSAYRYEPGPAEVGSWRNSLRAMAQVVERAKLADNGILLEYELPLSSLRLDCMLTGRSEHGGPRAVIVELKQWERCKPAEGECILTYTGGGIRDVLHPSVQVGGYCQYLADSHTAFHEGSEPIFLSACAYLHNYSFGDADPLLETKFGTWLKEFPIFSGDDSVGLIEDLRSRLGKGEGMPILNRIEQSKYRPSRKLLEHVGQLLKDKSEYILLDDQKIAFERVLTAARTARETKSKTVVLVVGGPGTGKSVIALNLMSALAREGLSSHYATGSSAFTQTLRQIGGTRAARMFKYFSSYMDADPETLDVVICDEAHRLRETSTNRYTSSSRRTGKPQIQELLDVARTSVFFIDDKQVVRPDEVGSTELIRKVAAGNKARLFEYRLQAQFRCSGADGYIQWVNNTLEIERTPTVLWNLDQPFEFRILESPEALDEAIHARLGKGFKARLMAGYAWKWSDPKEDGTLVEDVVIGGFRRPWNARPDARHLARGIPKAPLWAYKAGGEKQVGCIYTAQGFEFDYAGVIFAADLKYRSGIGWIGDTGCSFDGPVRNAGDRFTELVKNTYRVLLTRGMRGCYVCFLDKETEKFFRSRTEGVPAAYPEVTDEPKRLAAED